MFEFTENIDNIELQGGNDSFEVIQVKGGFPRIKICDSEFKKKLIDLKPREFSNDNVVSIFDILKNKKKQIPEELLLSVDQSIMPINIDKNISAINNIPISLITGKK